MERILLPVLLTFLISLDAQAGWRPLGRYFKLVPESEAHVFQGEAREKELDPKSIKTLVWNIKKALMMNWQTEFTSLARAKDIVLVQEAYGSPRFNETISTFEGMRWDFGISFLYRAYNDTPTGNMIGSVAQPSYVKVEHTLDFEPVVETPKTTTYAKYPLAGSQEELLVISVHGINITNFGSFRRHMNQARAEIEKHQGPVLFAGDFNTRTGARTRYLMQMIDELKFTPVTFKNGEHRMKFKFTPYYLDHSFVRGLKVKDARVQADSLGSDHKPMEMELEVTEAI